MKAFEIRSKNCTGRVLQTGHHHHHHYFRSDQKPVEARTRASGGRGTGGGAG